MLSASNSMGFIHIDAELITDACLEYLADIPNMYHLGVHAATDEILQKLVQFPRLRTLYLTEANLSGNGLAAVHQLPNLTQLIFVECTLPESGVGELATSLSDCIVKVKDRGVEGSQSGDEL